MHGSFGNWMASAVIGAGLLAAQPAAAAFTLDNSNADGGLQSGSFPSFTLRGGNNGSNNPGLTLYTNVFTQHGTMVFDWSYTSQDFLDMFDRGGYFLNGLMTLLSGVSGESGTNVQVVIWPGDAFGWYVDTSDNFAGAGFLTVSATFRESGAIPEPASLALLSFGLAGLAAARRRGKARGEA